MIKPALSLFLCLSAIGTAHADQHKELLQKLLSTPNVSYRAQIQIGPNTVVRQLEVRQGQMVFAGMNSSGDATALVAPARMQVAGSDAALKILFDSYQSTAEAGTTQIANRATLQIRLEPKDGWRYGRVLWLDTETGLPLRSQIFRRKEVIEQMQVRSFELLEAAQATAQPAAIGAKFAIRNLPKGFVLQQVRGDQQRIQHLYTDGLSQVSIFVQAPGQIESYGQTQTGALSYIAKRLGQIDVIGLGDVPPATLERMVSGVESLAP